MQQWVTQLRKGLLEFCLLNLLRRGESYGYEIVQTLGQIEELAITESTIYPLLSRLRKEGYLKVRTAPSPDGPPRRYFSLSRLGQRRVEDMNKYWSQLLVRFAELTGQSLETEEQACKSRKTPRLKFRRI